jgi:hypothetical protein
MLRRAGLLSGAQVKKMMESPAMQSLIDDPAKWAEMMQANPLTKKMLDTNPQLRALLADPKMIAKSFEAMRDPAMRDKVAQVASSTFTQAPTTLPPSGEAPGQATRRPGRGDKFNKVWAAEQAERQKTEQPTPKPAMPFANDAFARSMMEKGQEALQNNDVMKQVVGSSQFQQMLENPEQLQAAWKNNPATRALLESNPSLAKAMSNPELIRQSMQMMKDPERMKEISKQAADALKKKPSPTQAPRSEGAELVPRISAGMSDLPVVLVMGLFAGGAAALSVVVLFFRGRGTLSAAASREEPFLAAASI